MSIGFLLLGIVTGALFVALALAIPRFTRHILIAGLLVAALNYLGFATLRGASIEWVLTEVVGVAIFSLFTLCALQGTLWWLVAGWALHPAWDVGLHVFGTGRTIPPAGYVAWCAGLDAVVAIGLAMHLVFARRRTLVAVRAR